MDRETDRNQPAGGDRAPEQLDVVVSRCEKTRLSNGCWAAQTAAAAAPQAAPRNVRARSSREVVLTVIHCNDADGSG